MPIRIITLEFKYVIVRVLNGTDANEGDLYGRTKVEMEEEMHREIASMKENYEIDKCTDFKDKVNE